MAGKWPVTKIGTIAYSISDTHKMDKQHLVFLNTSDILLGKVLHHDYSDVKNWPGQAKKSIRRDDVLFSEIRPANGRWAYVDFDSDDYVVSTKLMVIRAEKEKLHPKFLYQYLTFPTTARLLQHLAESRSGTFPQITFSEIASLEIPLPPLEEQRAIARVIGDLDNKIELNRRTNETLEAMARALFKSWFVDFDGVAETDMQESELGLIPNGWRIAALDSIIDYLNGLTLQKFPPESESEFLPVIKIAQLRSDSTDGADKASTQIRPEYIIKNGDVLFSWSGSLEVEVWTGGRGALNQHLFKVTSREVPKWFCYFATRLHLPDFRSIAAGKATTMGHIQRGHLTTAKVAVPPKNEMDKFDAIIAPLFEQKIRTSLESRTLATMRDALLPKLISGELRVQDAAKQIAEAA